MYPLISLKHNIFHEELAETLLPIYWNFIVSLPFVAIKLYYGSKICKQFKIICWASKLNAQANNEFNS